jgi:A/G-specific adenine glycosylase
MSKARTLNHADVTQAGKRQGDAKGTPASPSFANRLVHWQRTHGRHDLPWQGTRDPYPVWLSEIMLQQTQVVTVKDYFARFMQRFPTVADLAAAHEDEVLGLWSGLGYYSRARNLHKAAQQVVALHGGVFPRDAHTLQSLPGIGPSTAAAIASICFGERVAILDGNVKRVLTRFLGFADDLAASRHEKALWQIAQDLVPEQPADMPTYTQAVMDLGATVCTPRQPRCHACPVQSNCVAHAQGQPEAYPVKTRRVLRRSESWWLLLAKRPDGSVWLQQREGRGVWAKLFCAPMFESEAALLDTLPAPTRSGHQTGLVMGEVVKHVLTHKDLFLHPVWWQAVPAWALPQGQWVAASDWPRLGLPAPVRKLLADTLSSAD